MLLTILLLQFVMLPGCGGCSSDEPATKQSAEEKKKEEEERRKREAELKKPDFEIQRAAIEPAASDAIEPRRKPLAAKPGHYFSVRQRMKTNHFDFVGELTAELIETSGSSPAGREAPAFHLTDTRAAVLPKGQPKNLEQSLFAPRAGRQASLKTELHSRGGGGAAQTVAEPIRWMPDYQYHFVILTNDPLRYRNWEKLDALRGPSPFGNRQAADYYNVSLLRSNELVRLPVHPLAWTSIAALLWDDVDPSIALSADQQRAMLDWLHWGGLLIVSGPDSLNGLRGSFLERYLPATAGASRELKALELAPLAYFAPDEFDPLRRAPEPIRSWSGVELKLQPDSEFLPHAAHLVAERRVGRGRVVVTAFRLNCAARADALARVRFVRQRLPTPPSAANV